MEPDYVAFQKVCEELRNGTPLNCKHIVDTFGWPAMELFLIMTPVNEFVLKHFDEVMKAIRGENK